MWAFEVVQGKPLCRCGYHCFWGKPLSQGLTLVRALLVSDIPMRTLSKQPLIFITDHAIIWCGMMCSFGISYPSCALMPTPACSLARWSEKWRNPWCCAGTHCSATVWTIMCYHHCFVTNPKQSTIGATMKKISSIPAGPKCRITGGSLHARLLECSMITCWNWGCTVHHFFSLLFWHFSVMLMPCALPSCDHALSFLI